jgi:hypothetical protein
MESKFSMGQVVATPGALDALGESHQDLNQFLARHAMGDWGEVGEEDWRANDAALEQGMRIVSAYTMANEEKLWLITEWDRSVTTALLPSEY